MKSHPASERMIDELFSQSLGIIVVSAAVLVMLGRLIRMPAIVVYLLCGVLIGPVLGLVEMSEALELISETGIALLLFLVGLELSFHKIRDVGKVAIVVGIGQVVFTGASAYLLCWLLGFSFMEGLFLAIALTFSSTVVVVKLLNEKSESASTFGRISVGVLLVQDLVVILILTILAGIGGDEQMEAMAITWQLTKAFIGMAILLAFALLASRHLLPRPFHWAARAPDMLLVWALTWCFVLVLAAHWLGLSLEIGAFLAGLSLAQLPYNEDLRRRVHPLMNLFVAVFFVSLGVRLDAGGAFHNWSATLALTLFVLIGKPLVFLLLIPRIGYSTRTAFFTGCTMAQISEFSFLIAGVGVAEGFIPPNILSIIALVGLLSISASAYTIDFKLRLFALFEKCKLPQWRIFHPTIDTEKSFAGSNKEHSHHVIVVGMNALGRDIVRRLCQRGETVIAIDTDPTKLKGLPCRTLHGSVEYLSVLEEAGYEHAKLLVSALRIEHVNDILAYRCQLAKVPCAVHVVDVSVADSSLELGAAYLMIPKVDGVKAQVRKLKEMGVIPS
jgi:Kef-type K+ transport system membrane component KefB